MERKVREIVNGAVAIIVIGEFSELRKLSLIRIVDTLFGEKDAVDRGSAKCMKEQQDNEYLHEINPLTVFYLHYNRSIHPGFILYIFKNCFIFSKRIFFK